MVATRGTPLLLFVCGLLVARAAYVPSQTVIPESNQLPEESLKRASIRGVLADSGGADGASAPVGLGEAAVLDGADIGVGVPASVGADTGAVAALRAVDTTDSTTEGAGGEGGRIVVVEFDWDYVEPVLAFVVFFSGVLFISTGYHQLKWVGEIIPESCIFIVSGVLIALVLWSANLLDLVPFPPRGFFLALLPPIILDASYDLNHREFGENMFGILLHAFMGTVLAFITISPTLWGLAQGGAMGEIDINYVECLVFGSFIVAVDPVAVLGIFNEVGVNQVLYFFVFGESLLNDGVTVVLFDGMDAIKYHDTVTLRDAGLFFGAFFVDVLGGVAIGAVIGALSSVMSRCTQGSKIMEFFCVFILAYFGYLLPQMLHWSAILGLVTCALIQAQFTFPNLQREVLISVRNFSHMIAVVAESATFFFIGRDIFEFKHEWNSGFVLWATFFCLVYRGFEVLLLTGLLNLGRKRKIRWNEIFMQWWGGLRGAVAYALVRGMDDDFAKKGLFITTTLFVIMFTVFVMGIMTKPLVKVLKVETLNLEIIMFVEMHHTMEDCMIQAMELISGYPDTGCFQLRLYGAREKCLGVTMSNPPMSHGRNIVDAYFTIMANKVLAESVVAWPEGKGQCRDCCQPGCYCGSCCDEGNQGRTMSFTSGTHVYNGGRLDRLEDGSMKGHTNPLQITDSLYKDVEEKEKHKKSEKKSQGNGHRAKNHKNGEYDLRDFDKKESSSSDDSSSESSKSSASRDSSLTPRQGRKRLQHRSDDDKMISSSSSDQNSPNTSSNGKASDSLSDYARHLAPGTDQPNDNVRHIGTTYL